MKQVGHTNDGGTLYELSQEEDRHFRALVSAVAGYDFNPFNIENRIDPATLDDFAGVFGAIRAFALTKFRVTEFRQMLAAFETALEKQDA